SSQRAGTAAGTSSASLSCALGTSVPRLASAGAEPSCAPVSGLTQRITLSPRSAPSKPADCRYTPNQSPGSAGPAKLDQLTRQPASPAAVHAGRPSAPRSCATEIGQPIG